MSKDTLAENNIGKIKTAINIPYAEIKQRMSELEKYRNSEILVYAASGDGDAARAAGELVSNGFTKVYNLLAGLNELVAGETNLFFLDTNIPFQLVDAYRTLLLLENDPGMTIYDTRPAVEFDNKDKLSYKNLGNIKNAVNVSEKNFATFNLPGNKNTPILIYGHDEAYTFAKMLGDKGYKKVYLMDGLYDFFWSSFNVENCKEAKKYLVNHEGIY